MRKRCKKSHRKSYRRNHGHADLYAIKKGQKWWDGRKWSWMDDRKRYESKDRALSEAVKIDGDVYHVYPVFSRKVVANPKRRRCGCRRKRSRK